jgi:hypothetical protein
MSVSGTTQTLKGGQGVSALPQGSGVHLLGKGEGVIDFHT